MTVQHLIPPGKRRMTITAMAGTVTGCVRLSERGAKGASILEKLFSQRSLISCVTDTLVVFMLYIGVQKKPANPSQAVHIASFASRMASMLLSTPWVNTTLTQVSNSLINIPASTH